MVATCGLSADNTSCFDERARKQGRVTLAVALDGKTPIDYTDAMAFQHFIRTLVACVLPLLLSQSNRADESPLLFETQIQPLLIAKCGKCHSNKVQKAALNLETIAGLRRGGESGEAVIGETLADSLLWTMIEDGDMPPSDEPQLSADEVARIRTWIHAGARSRQPVTSERELHQHDVLPIVLLRCTVCHGGRLQEGGLDLRTPAAMIRGGDSGPAVVPGDPDASRMMTRIETEACPPRDKLLKFFVRRPPPNEVDVLRQWIAAGAPVADVVADVATGDPDPLVSDADRQHWAFRPLTRASTAQSMDAFVLDKLQEVGLTFAPLASRDTLIRRAYLDLIGMPPSVEEWQKWRAQDDSDWYPQMVNALLDSPHYGERWGRYWLDVAGYADSEGGVSADPLRQVAWKYRDYVIRAFNSDKPYDRFLVEQIAGDELSDYENAVDVTDEMVENLVATGFLRMGIDQTGSRTMNFVPERLGVIDDAIRVLGSGVLGLTLECARCHSHKYDPFPQRDYYRMKAIFQGALDEHDWLTFKNRSLQVATKERRARVAKRNPPLLAELKRHASRHKKALAELRLETLRQHYPDQSEADRTATLQALRIADNIRSQTQRILVEQLQSAELLADEQQPQAVLDARDRLAEIEHEMASLRRQLEEPLTIRALWDRGAPSPTYILRRGDHDKPGQWVGPGVPSVLTDGKTPFPVTPPFAGKTGRRLAFAQWLTSAEHPLTARVMVNRIWHHHFGTGLVKSLENFGLQGERPSHPELLDWLAQEFVSRGWSVKAMHRLIMNSRTYRQSSRIADERHRRDPQNRLLSHMALRRMDAETLRDSLLRVSGKLDDTPFGPPDSVAVDRDGLVSVLPTPSGGWRRSIYVQYRRTEIPTMLDTFDYPEMGPNCVVRNVSNVSPQSLMLMNNGHVRELAGALATRILARQRSEDDYGWLVDTVYQRTLTRMPTQRERRLGIETYTKLQAAWQNDAHSALSTYCHIVLNSAAFLYID